MTGRLRNLVGAAFVAAGVSGALLAAPPCALASPDTASGTGSGATQSADRHAAVEKSPGPARPGKVGSRGNRRIERGNGDSESTGAADPAGRSAHVSKRTPSKVAPAPDRALPDSGNRPAPKPSAARVPAVGSDGEAAARRHRASTADPPKAAAVEDPAAVAIPEPSAATGTATRAPSVLNFVGSAVVNVLLGLIHLVDGPPILPPGSTVTVRSSSLVLPIGAGKSVEANWYFPEHADTSTRLIYLQHGFIASAPMYSYTAARLAERTDSIVVAPSLSSNFFDPDAVWLGGSTLQRAVAGLFAGDRRALTESASAAAGYAVTLPEKVVLVGHSAGGTLVTAAAGYMVDNGAIADLAGVVLLDGVEIAGSRAVSDALAKLRGVNDRPIYLMSSMRYFWNRDGDMADKLALARPGRFTGVGLSGGLHIDYLQGGNPLIQFAEYLVAGFSKQQNIDAAGIISAGWINDLFAGTTSGVYGTPGQSIPVATPAGTATATVFPLGQPTPNLLWDLVNGFFNAILNVAGVFAVFDPLTPAAHSQPLAQGSVEQHVAPTATLR